MSPLRKIVLFVIAVILLYLGVFYVLSRVSIGTYPIIYGLSDGLNLKGGNTYQKFREFDTTTDYDVVILGSSHAYRGYDPRMFERFGYRAFNLGTSSQTPYNSYHIIKGYLDRKNTRLVLLDVFYVASQLSALESTADLVQNLDDDKVAFQQAYNLPDPRAWNMFTLRMLTKDQAPFYLDSSYVGSGFSENRRSGGAAPRSDDGPLRMIPLQKEYLQKIADVCGEKGLDLVLVDHPSPTHVGRKRMSEMHRFIEDFAEENEVVFLNFAMDHDLDDERHFYDHTHLNQAGVDRFNPVLIERLEASGLLVAR